MEYNVLVLFTCNSSRKSENWCIVTHEFNLFNWRSLKRRGLDLFLDNGKRIGPRHRYDWANQEEIRNGCDSRARGQRLEGGKLFLDALCHVDVPGELSVCLNQSNSNPSPYWAHILILGTRVKKFTPIELLFRLLFLEDF